MRQSRCCIPLPVWGRSERPRYEMCAPSEPQTLHRPWLDSQEAYVVHVCAFQVLPISWAAVAHRRAGALPIWICAAAAQLAAQLHSDAVTSSLELCRAPFCACETRRLFKQRHCFHHRTGTRWSPRGRR